MEESSFEKVDCFLKTHLTRFGFEDCDDKVFIIGDLEIGCKTRSS
jgi:hypothetical protein